MRKRCPPSRGISRMLPPSCGLDGALGADVGEVGDGEHVHDAPRVVGLVAGDGAADRLAHPAARAVRADDVLGPDGALLALVGAGGVAQRHRDGVLALAVTSRPTNSKP